MKKILFILCLLLSVVTFSIESITSNQMPNEEFIQNIIDKIDADPEIMEKMDKIGEEVDREVEKENPDWTKVEMLYNELSIYTNGVAVDIMKTLKEKDYAKENPDFEEEINNEVISDMIPDGGYLEGSLDEKKIMDAINSEMTLKELDRMDELSTKISIEIEKENPNWDEVEKDYNELSKYTNRITVIIMKIEKENIIKNGVE